MSKISKIHDIKKTDNKAFTPLTPRVTNQKKVSSTLIRKKTNNYTEHCIHNDSSIIKTESSISNLNNSETIKSPKDILIILLNNCLGSSLIKIEKNTKDHMKTLKSIYKDFTQFKQKINLLKIGIEKKKKDEEKKLMKSKKIMDSKQLLKSRPSKTPLRIRSKTYQNISNNSRENSYNNKSNKNKINSKTIKRRKSIKNNLENSYKSEARTSRSKINNSNKLDIKPKASKERINYYKKIEKTQNKRVDRENKNNKCFKRLSTTSGIINMKKSQKSIYNINERYNTTNTDNNNTSKNINSRSKKRKRSIKVNERILERRKSIKALKKDENNLKGKLNIKQKIKIDGEKKKRKSISKSKNNYTQENIDSPKIKEIYKNVSNFIFDDNILNSNINLNNDSLQKSIISLKDNSDIDLLTNENININEIINEKEMESEKKKEKENDEEQHNIKNTIKELEEFNEKKAKLNEEEKNIINNKRLRSYSKNREHKNFCSWSVEKDFQGSLNDVKLMIEGVSGVLRKINIHNSKSKYKFRKKLFIDDSFCTEINSEKKLNKKKENKNKNNKLLNEIDKEITELIEAEEKRNLKEEKEKEKEMEIEKMKLEISDIKIENNIQNINFKNNKDINLKKDEEIKRDNINNPNKKNKLNKKIKVKEGVIKNNNIKTIKKENNPIIINENELSLKINNVVENSHQIINEDLISINKSQNYILINSLDEKNNKKIENKDNKNEIKERNKNDKNKNKNEINYISNKKENENKEAVEEKNNYLNNIRKLIEKNKLNIDEKSDIIQNESRIMRDEQLVDLNNLSLNQSSLTNQSLLDRYILISKEPDIPFSIENVLKFEKNKCLGILNYLNFQEKLEFTGIHRGFNIERISLLNYKREEIILSLELSKRETLNDLILKVRLNYSNEELLKSFNQFIVSTGPAKAVELLNNELYSKLFRKNHLEKKQEEIIIIYRTLFALFGEYDIVNITNNDLFWKKCIEYLAQKSNGKIGTLILEKISNTNFDHKKILLLNKLLIGMKKKILPNFYSKICGTTGLLIFIIKDALEYCGVIQNEKKTQPSRILDNLLCYKNTIDTLAFFIDYLSGIKTYRITDKKVIK